MFLRYAACVTAGSQRNSGSPVSAIIAHTSSTNVQFIRSAAAFWDSEYSAVS